MDLNHLETQKEELGCTEQFKRIVHKNFSDSSLTNDRIANILFMPRRTFYRTIKKHIGQSPSDYIRKVRLEKAYDMLNAGHYKTVKQVASKVGFRKVDYFSQIFKEKYGACPVEILRQA